MIHKLVVFKSFIGPDDVVNSLNESIHRVGFQYKRGKTEHHCFQENSAFSLAASDDGLRRFSCFKIEYK